MATERIAEPTTTTPGTFKFGFLLVICFWLPRMWWKWSLIPRQLGGKCWASEYFFQDMWFWWLGSLFSFFWSWYSAIICANREMMRLKAVCWAVRGPDPKDRAVCRRRVSTWWLPIGSPTVLCSNTTGRLLLPRHLGCETAEQTWLEVGVLS